MDKYVREVAEKLGRGRREKVYQNALAHLLNKNKVNASLEVPHPVYFDGVCVGTTFIDILTDTCLIEIKYVKTLNDTHREQAQAYSRDLCLDALLINFGANPVQIELLHADNRVQE